jgi:hypothetical protein
MKWAEILKKAFEYLKKYKFLWFLGVLAALTEGGVGSGFGNSGSNLAENNQDFEKFGSTIADWMTSHSVEISIIVAAIFIVSLIILYISYSSRAGLIYSVDKLESGSEKLTFSDAFHAGQKYFWRFLGLTVLISLMIGAVVFALVILMIGLVALTIATTYWLLLLVIPLGILAIVAIVVFAVYLSLILLLSFRVIVVENYGITKSITKSRELIHHNFANVLIAWLIQVAVGVVVGITVVVVALIIGGVLLSIGVGIFFGLGTIGAWVYGSVAVLAFIALMLLISGISNAFISTFWTVVYRRLAKSQ